MDELRLLYSSTLEERLPSSPVVVAGEDDLRVSLFKVKESCAMSSASLSRPGISASSGKTESKLLEIGQDAEVAGM